MNSVYDESYYTRYRLSEEQTVNYSGCLHLQKFFRRIAETIVEKYHPKTVLDAGCALGMLVKALRDLGVEAYGIDISEYAITHTDPSVSSYCRVCSLTEPLPGEFPTHFDMITCVEVLEHLTEADGKKAIANLCRYTDMVLFSSTSKKDEDPTHLNVRTSDFWASAFAEVGFYNQTDRYPSFLSADAYLFVRNASYLPAVERYERTINCKKAEIGAVSQQAEAQRIMLQENISLLKETLALQKELAENVKRENNTLNIQLQHTLAAYQQISRSQFWRITYPLRFIADQIKKLLKKIRSLLKKNEKISQEKCYSISKSRRKEESKKVFDRPVKFSILVPLYNTPKSFLCEMIESVQKQTYAKWELCLADGSDEQHRDVEKICMSAAKSDSRICYKKLKENKGISANTNECIQMATGDYFALLDHDDILHPSALFSCMEVICKENADFIYTDEATFVNNSLDDIVLRHHKPDFSPDTLRSYNYICHLSVFSRDLLEKVGPFNSEYDGSQDYDLILRLTEQAKKIVHIPELLYFWRGHADSTAASVAAKPYIVEAAHKALAAHLERVGLKGEVKDGAVPSVYKIEYELNGTPLVSILIPNKDHIADLEKCLQSIYEKTTYQNFEIIVIENNSEHPTTFQYYETLKKYPRLQVVKWTREFNYSAINNFGAQYASGEYLLLLNNDIEIISENWIQEMLMFAQRKDVGAVGAKLYYSDDTIQHAGVILGICGIAGHSHKYFHRSNTGYMTRASIIQNLSACTAACLLLRRDVFDEVGGLDEKFQVAFNDVDLCMKIRRAGYLIVFTPYAEMYHYESKSRGAEVTPQQQERFRSEINRFQEKWGKELEAGDPYYNPHLSLETEQFDIK